jgi:hypothetical protein
MLTGFYLLRIRHFRQEDDGLRLRDGAGRVDLHHRRHEAGRDLREAVRDQDHDGSNCKDNHLL